MRNYINLWNLLFVAAFAGVVIAVVSKRDRPENAAGQIFGARFAQTEFLGSTAIVPRPASEAGEKLRAFLEKHPEDSHALELLAAACESARDYACAEDAFRKLSASGAPKLADFYGRRRRFREQIEFLSSRLESLADKDFAVREILELASRHGYREYLSADWVISATSPNQDAETTVEHAKIIEAGGGRTEAIKLLETHATRGEKRPVFVRERVAMLERNGETRRAAEIYIDAFDPLWPDDDAQEFYRFLGARNILEKYGKDLRATFRKSKSNMFVAIRLADFSLQNGDEPEDFIRIAESEKARRGIMWKPDELMAAARFRRREQNLNDAARFLHAIAATNPDENARRAAAIEIFGILVDAADRKITLAPGDFGFFRNAASLDLKPGAATGILSVLTSDMNIAERFKESETNAGALFNLDAAGEMLRVATAVDGNSADTASMYRDLAIKFIALGERDRAERLLGSFESKLDEFSDWHDAAWKLAAAYKTAGDSNREQEIQRKILARTAPGEQRDGEARYEVVLARLVEIYEKDNGAKSALELYGREIERFPSNEDLRLEALKWLEKSGTVAEQEQAFRRAAAEFGGRAWTEKLARWFVRQRRDDDFAELAAKIVAAFPENETGKFLNDFMTDREGTPDSPRGKLFIGLYRDALERFPERVEFARRLLEYYARHNLSEEWNALALRYFCIDDEIRRAFIVRADRAGSLHSLLDMSRERRELPYLLFRAEANARLSKFETAFADYQDLRAAFPENKSIETAFLDIARSLGQTNRGFLIGAAADARKAFLNDPANADKARLAGEISAEAGEFQKAREMWREIIATGAGDPKTYLDAAATNWDYFMFEEALRIVRDLRSATGDERRLAFEAGAIYESNGDLYAALGEYFSAAADSDIRAARRIETLAGRDSAKSRVEEVFRDVLEREKDDFAVRRVYAEALYKSGRKAESLRHLSDLARSERGLGRLGEIKKFLTDHDETDARVAVLGRMAAVAPTTRSAAGYMLQVAQHYRENGETQRAAGEIRHLVARFPANFGVIRESSAFMLSIGRDDDAIGLLERAVPRAGERHRYILTRRIAELELGRNRAANAISIARELLQSRPDDSDAFSILANASERTGDLREIENALRIASAAIAGRGLSRSEQSWILEPFRRTAIRVFIRARDFEAAGDQYIELINRSPGDEELVEEALDFAVRTGGADRLIDYYRRTAATSFRNPRWNVILARLYRASGDLKSAIENDRAAIALTPDDSDIYAHLVEVLIEDRQFAAALEEIGKLIEIDGETDARLRQKISLLTKLGRVEESEALASTLPPEIAVPAKPSESKFERAARIAATDKTAATKEFRDAAASAAAGDDPVKISPRDLQSYLDFLRAAREPSAIREIFEFVRKLRSRSQSSESRPLDRENSAVAEKAFVAAVAKLAETSMTIDEFGEIAAFLNEPDGREEIRFMIDIARAAKLADCEEKLIRANYKVSQDRVALEELLGVLRRRGKFAESLAIALPELPDTLPDSALSVATDARMIGDAAREIAALRIVAANNSAPPESLVRFVELGLESNREELSRMIKTGSPNLPAIAGILFDRGENELAETALSSISTSVDVRKTLAKSRIHFRKFTFADGELLKSFLGPLTVGEISVQKTDDGNRWFEMADTYADWLNRSGNDAEFERFAMAEAERFPQSARAHFDVGIRYHNRRDFARAYEHFRIAASLEPTSTDFHTFLGAAAFHTEGAEKAREIWLKMLGKSPSAEAMTRFVRVHHEFGHAADAREAIFGQIGNVLTGETDDETLIGLLRAIGATFGDTARRDRYFLALPEQTRVAELVLRAQIAKPDDAMPFARIVLNDIASNLRYQRDYQFDSAAYGESDQTADEAIYDAETDFSPREFESEDLKSIEAFITELIDNNQLMNAQELVGNLAKAFRRNRPRPIWLRRAEFRIGLRRGELQKVLGEMEIFSGLRSAAGSSAPNAPDVDRVRISVDLLEAEGRLREAELFGVRSSGRRIAFGVADESDFAALASWLKNSGNESAAISVLRAMTDERGRFDLELTSNVAVREYVGDFISPAPDSKTFDAVRRLSTAAAVATDLGLTFPAREFRLKLAEISPPDASNLTELARLEIANGELDAGLRRLSAVAANSANPISQRHFALAELAKAAGRSDDARSLATRMLDEQNVAAGEKALFSALSEIFNKRMSEGRRNLAQLPDSEQIRAIRCEYGETDAVFAADCYGSFTNADSGVRSVAVQIRRLLDAGLFFAAVRTANEKKLIETARTIRDRRIGEEVDDIPTLFPQLSDAAAAIGDFRSAVSFAEAAGYAAPEGDSLSAERIGKMREMLRQAEEREANRFRVVPKE